MQIIPAIDIIDGKCVRLTQGDYAQKKIYNESPLEVAKEFEASGINRLHLVDLDGAKAGKVQNWKVLESIASNTHLSIDFGGGIKTEKDLAIVFQSGATMATIGSLAVKDAATFKQWIHHYGANKFFLGADVKDELISVGGWLESTNIDVFNFIQSYINEGLNQVFCTDISKDGKLEGPSVELYKKIITQFPNLFFVASGGVSCLEDLNDLNRIGCSGVIIGKAILIIGKAIYEGRITLKELISFITTNP
jgi:phosphoribosylformimino-5-aminoimidazole carboxamide ribotide isomerase